MSGGSAGQIRNEDDMADKPKNPNQGKGKATAPGQNKTFINPVSGETRTGTMGQFNKENWADEGFQPQEPAAEDTATEIDPGTNVDNPTS